MINKIQLTISILSSGRINTVERCLKSLLPFKERMNTQIIVTDTTGNGDGLIYDKEVRSILYKYADVIIPFKWCDDFSAARNIGLKETLGEWFLYIDDDEWFENPNRIIDFLLSKESKNYNRVDIEVKSFVDKELEYSSVCLATRLVRRTDELTFKGYIHEYFTPIDNNPKVLFCPILHTGYIFDNEEDRFKHTQRNLILLEKAINEDPGQTRWWLQLLQEYETIKEWDKIRELSDKYIKQIYNTEVTDDNRKSLSYLRGLL